MNLFEQACKPAPRDNPLSPSVLRSPARLAHFPAPGEVNKTSGRRSHSIEPLRERPRPASQSQPSSRLDDREYSCSSTGRRLTHAGYQLHHFLLACIQPLPGECLLVASAFGLHNEWFAIGLTVSGRREAPPGGRSHNSSGRSGSTDGARWLSYRPS